MGILEDGSNGAVVDTRSFFDSAVPERMAELIGMGVLVSVGSARDRGALSFRATYDGESDREWCRYPDEAADWMARIAAALRARGVGVTDGNPAPVQKPTRRF